MTDFKKMAKDVNFMLFTVVFSVGFSIYTCLGATVDFLVHPYGYSNQDVAIVGAGFIVCGIIGCLIFGIILGFYPKYLLVIRFLVVALFIVCIPYFWTLPSKNVWLLLANNCAFGFFALPLVPIGTLFCIEISFPINEAMSLGWIFMWA